MTFLSDNHNGQHLLPSFGSGSSSRLGIGSKGKIWIGSSQGTGILLILRYGDKEVLHRQRGHRKSPERNTWWAGAQSCFIWKVRGWFVVTGVFLP